MLTERLLVTLAVNALLGAASIGVGLHLWRRPAVGGARRALVMFSLWWIGLGADTLLNALTWLAGGLGVAGEPLTAALTYLALASIVLMTWGLTYYLVYLITGREGLFAPIAAFYGVSAALAVALIAYLRPVGVTMTAWSGEIAYANEPPPIAALLFAMYFLLPPLLGAITYGLVGLRVKERAGRYRILAVAVGIFVWFTSALVFTGTGPAGDAKALSGKVLAATCMALIVSAYVQPAWLARWLEGGQGPVGGLDASALRARRRAALNERVRDLL